MGHPGINLNDAVKLTVPENKKNMTVYNRSYESLKFF